MRSAECKRCGCHLDRTDVRQLALYYRQEQSSLVVVQYLCPHCGASEWREYDPEVWQGETSTAAAMRSFDWNALAAGIQRVVPVLDESAFIADPTSPISLDEYIEFARRIDRLEAADLAGLH